MQAELRLRSLIREMINEALEPQLLGTVGNKKSIVLGDKAQQLLLSKGMTPAEVSIVVQRLNNISVDDFFRYDQTFKQHAAAHRLKPALLKAMSIEETTLGKSMANQAGSTAAGLLQVTKPTLDTLNANLPKGVHYDYKSLLSNPAMSIKIAAHYIQQFLIGKRGLKSRSDILKAYKTGPDAANYAARVEAFKKFVDIVGI